MRGAMRTNVASPVDPLSALVEGRYEDSVHERYGDGWLLVERG
jgi:hypothetical protein